MTAAHRVFDRAVDAPADGEVLWEKERLSKKLEVTPSVFRALMEPVESRFKVLETPDRTLLREDKDTKALKSVLAMLRHYPMSKNQSPCTLTREVKTKVSSYLETPPLFDSISPPAKCQIGEKAGKDQENSNDAPETEFITSQRNTANIHPKEPGNHIDWQG